MSSLISVIIPIFNRSEWSLRAVNSVLAQTYSGFELVVVDDGSTMDMSAVEEAVCAAGQRFLRKKNAGVAAARNIGAAETDGEWIAFLDSDDVWEKNKLEEQLQFLRSNSWCRICQTEEQWIRRGRHVNQRSIHQKPDGEAFFQSLRLCCISPSSVMIARNLFDQCGGFDHLMPVCEDYDLWLRVTAQESVGLVRRPLVVKHGGHADQLSRSQPAIDRFRVYALVKISTAEYLSERQRTAVLAEIAAKCGILIAGAKKRRNERVLGLYGELRSHAEKCLRGEGDWETVADQMRGRLANDLLGNFKAER